MEQATSPDDPATASSGNGFPTAALIGVFVAVTVLGLAFVACGITRSRQQRRRQQMFLNHQQFYASENRQSNLNKPLPGTATANLYSPRNNSSRFGNTTNIYSTYSSGGGPPVFVKDEEMGRPRADGIIEAPPPAYEPTKGGISTTVSTMR